MPHFSFPELLIIMVVILLLFGAKRIPEIAGSMGKGIKEFKKQMNEAERALQGDDAYYSRPRLTDDDLQQQPASGEQQQQRPEPKRLIS
jgi:sec-independent protein translocase protein TatA